MCSVNCILFGAINLREEEVRGNKVLEVGSCDVNGSLRPFIESRDPEIYVGVDVVNGPGVDVICDGENLLDKFQEETFDIVISTELLEHVRNWAKVVSNIKKVCKPGGIILITTRSIGFPFHGYPYDFWRYELEDMEAIFSDCEIQVLEKDPDKGVFFKGKKPHSFRQKDLYSYELYSIAVNKRIKELIDKDLRNWHFRKLVWGSKAKYLALRVQRKVWVALKRLAWLS